MTVTVTTLLDKFNSVFPLNLDETLKLQLMLTQGYKVIVAGYTVWSEDRKGDLVRTTNQLQGNGLALVPDESASYYDLMDDLDGVELECSPQIPELALWFLTVKGDEFRFHAFSRSVATI